MRTAWLVAMAVGAAGGGAAIRITRRAHAPALTIGTVAVVPEFVGERVCAACHPAQAVAWSGSHHARAMQPASEALGDTRAIRRHDNTYVMRVDGADYPISYTFGVEPLQQYVIAFPGGRFQLPELAWDSRTGGWFHIDRDVAWTGVAENWNTMCADCHSTNVRKGWSARSATYATRVAEISVSCEACHGPGSRHVAWAMGGGADRKGLALTLDERRGVWWPRTSGSNEPRRSRTRTTEREIEMCARCHSRRELIHEDSVHGQPLHDDYRVALLDEELYYPDGQIKGEVYEYGSFVQSRMYAEGVTCSDCHDPHSGKLRAPGDSLCLQCHAASYATASHHFHRDVRCASCHMPATSYMVVDARRDHSLRVPRPDLTAKLGVPNPCNGCHTDRSAAWAAGIIASHSHGAPNGFQQFAEALAAGRQGAPDADDQLTALIANAAQPAIVRASALALLQDPELPIVRAALADGSPIVRGAAVRRLADTSLRDALLPRLLQDPVRAVRLDAASALELATPELIASYELNGDRPEAHVALATLATARRDFEHAEIELRRALALDPTFVPASVNLADLYRVMGRDADAETCLREELVHVPGDASLQYALGLALVREQRVTEALGLLAAAARDGADARRGYVYAVALHDTGDTAGAVRELEAVVQRHPYDRESLAALAAYQREVTALRSATRR